jgi:hypothetical protein
MSMAVLLKASTLYIKYGQCPQEPPESERIHFGTLIWNLDYLCKGLIWAVVKGFFDTKEKIC